MIIIPKLDILPEEQRLLWPRLKDTPQEFVLYGGTAVALRFGHRTSVDFDFFTNSKFDLTKTREIPYIKDTPFDVEVHSNQQFDFFLKLGERIVKVTFLNNPEIMPGCINPPDTTPDNRIKVASPLDLMAAKILALQHRTEEKDFIDVGELITNGISLQKGFEAAYAITKISNLRPNQIFLDRLAEDLKSKSVTMMLPKNPELAALIRKSATEVDLKKVERTSMRAKKDLDFQQGLSR